MIDLRPAADQLLALLPNISQEDLDKPTPCGDDFTVAALLDHFMTLCAAFRDVARKMQTGLTTSPPYPDAHNLDSSWRSILPNRVEDLVVAWSDPLAWEGETNVGGRPMPADFAGHAVLDELVMHTWDIAKAIGQPFVCDEKSAEAVLQFTSSFSDPGMEQLRDGLFGPVIDIRDSASDFDRALGYAGRSPSWTP